MACSSSSSSLHGSIVSGDVIVPSGNESPLQPSRTGSGEKDGGNLKATVRVSLQDLGSKEPQGESLYISTRLIECHRLLHRRSAADNLPLHRSFSLIPTQSDQRKHLFQHPSSTEINYLSSV